MPRVGRHSRLQWKWRHNKPKEQPNHFKRPSQGAWLSHVGLIDFINFFEALAGGPTAKNAFFNIYPLHEMNHRPFAMTKPFQKALSWNVVVSSPRHSENNTFTLIFRWWALWLGNFIGSIIACGCFISTERWKIQPFFQFSPWRDPRLRHLSGYPFGTSRKKHQLFSITQPFYWLLPWNFEKAPAIS